MTRKVAGDGKDPVRAESSLVAFPAIRYLFNSMKGIWGLLLASLFFQSARAQGITLGEAIDSPELEWRYTLGAVPFSTTASAEAIDQDIASVTLAQGQFVEISTTLPSSGIIDFLILGGGLANWTAFVNDEPLDLSSGNWPYGFRVDGEGAHTFRIRHVAAANEETISLDGVIFRPDATVDFTEALDAPGQTWTSPDATKWVGSPYFSHDGEDAAWIGGLADGEMSSLKTTIEGPAEFSFWWQRTRASDMSGEFLINGLPAPDVNGPKENRWEQVTYTLDQGIHEIEWKATGYASSRESPARGLWIDQFTVNSITEGALSNFGPPLPGARVLGELFQSSPGVTPHSTAIGLNKILCVTEGTLIWPIASSQNPRRISFYHQNAEGIAKIGSTIVEFNSSDTWKNLSILIPAGASSLTITAGGSPGLLDQFEIEDVLTTAPSEVIGSVANQLSFSGWHGSPATTENSEPTLLSPSFGSNISGTIAGPAWLRFESAITGNGKITLTVDGQIVLTTISEPATYLIPPGLHHVGLLHEENYDISALVNGFEQSQATINDLIIEPLLVFPLETTGGLPLTQSGNIYIDPQSLEEIPWAPFFKTIDDEIHAVVGPTQNIQLSTTVTGPALVSFDRQVNFYRESIETSTSIDHGPCTSGTTTTNVGPFDPAPADPGTNLIVNGISAFASGESGGLLIPLSFFVEPAEEPMDQKNPLMMPNFRPVQIGVRKPSTREGWESFSLFLGPGDHELSWTVGAAPNDNSYDGHSAQWNHLKLANLQMTPVIDSYAHWANQQWTADPEVENAVTKLGPWQDPLADPDQDGVSNAMEYAYGTDPRSKESLPPAHRVATAPRPMVHWAQPPSDGPEVQWRPSHSPDLINWSDEGLSNITTASGFTSELITPAASAFFRLEVDVTIPAE